ncbi:MAG: HEAT repeat domain-containing protein [Gemmataceae bacterium]|nr:HEAT repeat domain-containing protein [Gemmataceae bacterium]
MSAEKFLLYRGDIKGIAAVGVTLAFVTVHPEGQPTAVYRLDPEKLALTETALPAGGTALLAVGDELWIAGTDRQLYRLKPKSKKPAAFGTATEAPAVALAPLADERLAVAAGTKVLVLARADGQTLQELELPEEATSLAADPTGRWLAAGTSRGTVAVYESETEPVEYRLSDSAPLHEAAVTALLFEADELRFLSGGADQKLLSTHARGRLEAEDRGRGAMHDQPVSAMVAGPVERFITGSADGTLKSWPKAKAARPVTLKDGMGKAVALCIVPVHGRPQVAAACDDDSIRLFALDEEGKFGDQAAIVRGADDWAKHELGQSDPKRREAALKALAGFADSASFKRIAAQMSKDGDHELRVLACKLLGDAGHPKASRELEKGLQHKEEAIRLLSFEGLMRHAAPGDLRPANLAIKADKADIGVRAVKVLEKLAGSDEQARARLEGALASPVAEVRKAALASLENVLARDSPEASLTALGTAHADLRRLALVRLMERKLLHDPRAESALRWRGDDPDPEVRRVAFLLSLHTRGNLLAALRQRDPDLARQLAELEAAPAGGKS